MKSGFITFFLVFFLNSIVVLYGQNLGRDGMHGVSVETLHATSLLQTTNYKLITLRQALDIAGTNYPSVKAKQSDVQANTYNLRSAKYEHMPDLLLQDQYLYSTVNTAVGAYYSNEGTAIPISGSLKTTSSQAVWGSFSTLMVDWRFFNFGKVKSDINVARNQFNKSTFDYENEVFQQKVKVADSYLLLIALLQLESVQEKNLARAQQFYTMARAYSMSGFTAGVDSSLSKADLSKARLLYLQSQKNVDIQKYNLMTLMGINNDFNIDTSAFVSKIPAVTYPDSSALVNNTVLKLYTADIDILKERARQIKLSYLPSIHLLSAGWARGSGVESIDNSYVLNSSLSEGIPYKEYNYMVGLSFIWDIASAPRIFSESKSFSMLADEAQYNYKTEFLQTKEELDNANLEFQNALQEVKETPVQYHAALDAYNQSKSRYDAGLISFYDVSQAIYVLNRAEADMYISYNDVWRALLKQAAATGNIHIFTNNVH